MKKLKKLRGRDFLLCLEKIRLRFAATLQSLTAGIQDKTDIALIFDKYFLGYMISYELIRLRFQNKHFLSYFADKGDDAHYFGMRVHEIGADGFIPKIEDVESFKKCIYQVQSGVKVYPESITRSFENDDWLLDKAYINEVTIPEMLIGIYTSLGCSQKEISYNIHLSTSTVSEYTRQLRRKIGYSKPGDWDLLFKSFLTNFTGDFYGCQN